MADFPYTPHPAGIPKFFDHIQKAGVPTKVTYTYLSQVGFKSSNDRYLVGVLKFIGFVDGSGAPSTKWQAYRSRSQGKRVIAAALREGYADLFRTFPDADRKDNEALRNYFSAHTKVAEYTLGLIVTTFKRLCELGDFESAPIAGIADAEEPKAPAKHASLPRTQTPPSNPAVPAVNINIQLQLPATDDAGVYDKLFAALKKHLLTS